MKRLAALLMGVFLGVSIPLAGAETVQQGGIRVSFHGQVAPQKLPRHGSAPVTVSVSTRILRTADKPPPQLTRISIAINRNGRLDYRGLPVCGMSDIQPATNEKALAACRAALVGEGQFAASVDLDRQGTFPSSGKMLAFNGTYKGRPAILAHVFGSNPIPTSFTLPFVLGRTGGTFGSTLTATLPAGGNSSVTAIDLKLHRTFTFKGKRHSYASAGCPVPGSLEQSAFPFARASFSFAGGKKLSSTLIRTCRAR